jgi:ribonucleoside-diphosphate reductase alpha chain
MLESNTTSLEKNQTLSDTPSNLRPQNAKESASTTLGSHYSVNRRNGKRTPFDVNKISIALTKAFLAVEGHQAASSI